MGHLTWQWPNPHGWAARGWLYLHELAKVILYPLGVVHGSPYHIYYPAYFGNSFIYIWYGAYHMSGTYFSIQIQLWCFFVIGLSYLEIILGMLDMYHIIYVWDLFFQYKFDCDVFMIRLPYLVIISKFLIWDISHMSRACFSMWIQLWCLFVIELPYLVILANVIIGVSKTTSAWRYIIYYMLMWFYSLQ